MIKVLAFRVGVVDHETERAIKLEARWYPKSAVSERLITADGYTALVFRSWFVQKNEYLAYTELGELITRWIELGSGEILYQGDARRVSIYRAPEKATNGELDARFDELLASGMSEAEASKVIRQEFAGRI